MLVEDDFVHRAPEIGVSFGYQRGVVGVMALFHVLDIGSLGQ